MTTTETDVPTRRHPHIPRPQSRLCRISTTGDDGLGDYIKMNPVSCSATLPASLRGQPPDFSSNEAQYDRLCKSYEGKLGVLDDDS